ncbi:MAG: hypothetical protein GXY07_00225 [Candidatus Hydrogenedentes bacterium]|nr:hypothetical protein [Candidatus Hydrogenedentota bacterium]
MMKKNVFICVLILAITGPAFAVHTPVPDMDSCPPTVDEYGTPINWNFVPLPLFNINVLGSTVNFTPIAGQVDFCAYTDIIFCSLGPVGDLVPEVMAFANLVQCNGFKRIYEWTCPCTSTVQTGVVPDGECVTYVEGETSEGEIACQQEWVRGSLVESIPVHMDINGPIDLQAELPVTGNGIPDGQYELGILAAIYNDDTHPLHATVVAAYQANYKAVKDLIVDALAAANLKNDKDLRPIVQSVAPYLVRALSSILAGFATMADPQTNMALDQLLLLLAEIGIAPPEGGIAGIATGIPELGPEGDADGGGATNRQEYEYFVTVLGYGPAEYVAAALDPAQEPPVENEGETETEGEGEAVPEGEGEIVAEGEVSSEGEGEGMSEGEAPYEGEPSGEGEFESEGEIPAEGEIVVEGEGEAAAEGEIVDEGEGEAAAEGEIIEEGEGEAAAEGEIVEEGEGETAAEGEIIEEGEGEAAAEGEIVEEGEGEAPAEGEGEAPAEGEGEAPSEGEGEIVAEGEGEALAEGEGEVIAEGEGEALAEGEGEVIAEGEGEAPAEGEGEDETSSCCGTSGKDMNIRKLMDRTIGDWLLIGMSLLGLTAFSLVRK